MRLEHGMHTGWPHAKQRDRGFLTPIRFAGWVQPSDVTQQQDI
jgi:hypothetical protein